MTGQCKEVMIRWMGSGYCRVCRMFAKQVFIAMLVAAGLGQIPCRGESEPVQPAAASGSPPGRVSRQLEINRDALLQGPTEPLRVNAAIELLLSDDPSARTILVTVFRDEGNPAARDAVCKALGQARGWDRLIENKDDFLTPLLEILQKSKKEQAGPAAEALLMFEYRELEPYLLQIINAAEQDISARLNALYVLRLRPEMEAILQLVKLREHADKAIAASAENQLQELLGIPVGTDEQTWRGLVKELQRKNRYEFMRDQLIRSGLEVNRLREEIEKWRKAFISALDEVFGSKSDEAERGAFVVKQLGSDWPEVRLWALEKVRQWRLSGKDLPAGSAAALAKLISDSQVQVRLSTAELLGRMGDLRLARQLLEQLRVETQEPVKIELLGALGEACYTQLSLNPQQPSPEEAGKIREEALAFAGEYLASTADAPPEHLKRVQKAAAAMRKLLEPKGLEGQQAIRYLSLLGNQYAQERAKPENPLTAELLNVMAALCGDASAHRAAAAELYRPLFLEAVSDKSNAIRAAAVTGLANIDKVAALLLLRDKRLTSDPSPAVRAVAIQLAGAVGGKDDIGWLAGNLATDGTGDGAWQAMRSIFERSETPVLLEWADKFSSDANSVRPGNEGLLQLLQMAEQKAVQQNEQDLARQSRLKLGDLHSRLSRLQEAARYYGMVAASIQQPQQRDAVLGKLLDVNLRAANTAAVKELVANRLLEKTDIGQDDIFVVRLDAYFANPPGQAEAKALLDTLSSLPNDKPRPNWTGRIQRWQQQLGLGQVQPKEQTSSAPESG